MVRRIYVEKREDANPEVVSLLSEIVEVLEIKSVSRVRILKRYDVSGITDEEYKMARATIFLEPQLDICYDEVLDTEGAICIATEYLPGQYDQRADYVAQCVQILTGREKPMVKVANVYLFYGTIATGELETIKNYLINPVESRKASCEKPKSLGMITEVPADVEVLEGFIQLPEEGLTNILETLELAMDMGDLKLCQNYFQKEGRNPTITEVRMLDTYWSDHCRHTTFLTNLTNVEIEDELIKSVFNDYINTRNKLYKDKDKPVSLMDMATIAAREMSAKGLLKNFDKSEEVNACSIVVEVNTDKGVEEYLIMFKNETHNHPTEIEPFGGAATCLGGAIRDPLSGRSYVYQAMRITGAGDPREPISKTLPGKLPQRTITTTASAGYSSYGNQIGVPAGLVREIYHPGYVAKRMELGAVIAAAPKKNVVREEPGEGDVVILLGGKTGRDGCGGATGSSKAHTEDSLETCGAEVQKGNPSEERKIQRLFRKEQVTKMIKRCNDFGAGGVSVAIGELAPGLLIDLDVVPKKYEGLDGTELAISESQERMAVVVSKNNCEAFIKEAEKENLEATKVAQVTRDNRLTMTWRGKKIVDIDREFLDSNGSPKAINVKVISPDKINMETINTKGETRAEKWLSMLSDLNVCSQKGLAERFDASIGAGTVFMPFGGKYQQTPTESMMAKIPVLDGDTTTATVMAHGFNPYLSAQSPFHGAVYAVVEAVTKAVAAGADRKDCYLTFQEFFERLGDDPFKWGKPTAALLGAYYAQKALQIASIGGKDSMSGSFNDMDVPPTLVAFAVSPLDALNAVSNEFKEAGSKIYLINTPSDKNDLPDMKALTLNLDLISTLIRDKKIKAAHTVCGGGICEAVSRMCFGNMLGCKINVENVFSAMYGSVIIETDEEINHENVLLIGETIGEAVIYNKDVRIELARAHKAWQEPLQKVFPEKVSGGQKVHNISFLERAPISSGEKFAIPQVFIPIFPGTNCEYDIERAFKKTGAKVQTMVFKNLSSSCIKESVELMKKHIDNSQIIMLPGGLSAGDEPADSGKFVATIFRNPVLKQSVMSLLNKRDGLILGISSGFQALIKLGLVPYGEIRDMEADSPALTFNKIGRHMSSIVRTRVSSVKSPWLSCCEVGDIHTLPISHGEGRFLADDEALKNLVKNGQIATQYVDFDGEATTEMPYNPNGSVLAVEGITSPDGRVFGKMAHSGRWGNNVYKNIPGEKNQKIFSSGVNYFR